LALIVFWHARHFPPAIVLPILVIILAIELTFFAANSAKLVAGGYVPVLIGLTIIVTMLTWLRGRSLLADKLRKDSVELEGLLETLERRPPTRVAGAAVFLQTDPIYAPSALMPFWQQRLFIMLANQSARAIEFFRIPPERVVELGMQMSV